VLAALSAAASSCFGDNLRSLTLFGSGAEGRLRSTSDLNLLVVLRGYDQAQVDAFREPLRMARMAAGATAMFLLEAELPAAAEAFAVKFDDICRRRRVLVGDDVVAGLAVSRDAMRAQLKQALLNLVLRLRERYASLSLREEQLAAVVADSAGPLRASAATLLELEGRPAPSAKEALAALAAALGDGRYAGALELVSQAREARSLPPGEAAAAVFALIDLARALLARAERLA
jgi:predicted nucleotidyltransferase